MTMPISAEYAAVKRRLLSGWNTWNTRSVTSHVLLAWGLALNLGFKSYAHNAYLKEALIGRKGEGAEKVRPLEHAGDGSYTALHLTFHDVACTIETAHGDGDSLVVLVTPTAPASRRPALVVLEPGFLWNRPGHIVTPAESFRWSGNDLLIARRVRGPGPTHQDVPIYTTATPVEDPYVPALAHYLAAALDQPVGFSTHVPRDVGRIREILDEKKAAYLSTRRTGTETGTWKPAAGDGAELAETAEAIGTAMAWDTVYDPQKDRAISTVSRLWNVGGRSGWVLFCWDAFFGASLAALHSKDLAYANALEILGEAVPLGDVCFVPNNAQASGRVSRDRSQPPVGSLTLLELYRQFGDAWVLAESFDTLLGWNRFWDVHRREGNLLCWGSHPFAPVVGDAQELRQPNTLLGAALESGLDNSPMYDPDETSFDPVTHRMGLHDVGLNALYIADCVALAEIAAILQRPEASELRLRAATYTAAMDSLWHEPTGLYLNRRTDTGAFQHRLTPTHFYPLLVDIPPVRAERMIREHLMNPEEFWGEWVLPSVARNDRAFGEQDYWRGPIWGPMNYLVFLGLRRRGTPAAEAACRGLVDKSRALLLKEWRSHRHVHENYHAVTGEGCVAGAAGAGSSGSPGAGGAGAALGLRSDPFYHWGGLLGLMSFGAGRGA